MFKVLKSVKRFQSLKNLVSTTKVCFAWDRTPQFWYGWRCSCLKSLLFRKFITKSSFYLWLWSFFHMTFLLKLLCLRQFWIGLLWLHCCAQSGKEKLRDWAVMSAQSSFVLTSHFLFSSSWTVLATSVIFASRGIAAALLDRNPNEELLQAQIIAHIWTSIKTDKQTNKQEKNPNKTNT